MRVFIIVIVFFLFIRVDAYGQKKMTKNEILDYWTTSQNNILKEKDSINIIRFNKGINDKVESIIDSLSKRLIDSIIVYSVSFPGYVGLNNKCISSSYPINAYIFWKEKKSIFLRKLINGCDSGTINTNSTFIFEYYIKNYEIIDKENIMPVIYKAIINQDGTMDYTGGSINHQPNYSIYFQMGNHVNQKMFTENYIENKESLFCNYNRGLKIYKLFQLIDNETKRE